MRKITLISVLTLLTSISFGQNTEWIKFNWQGQDIFGKYYDKVAITIPLKIDNLPYNFCGQFDLGATRTLFYGTSLKNFIQPSFLNKLDTTIAPYYLNGNKGNFLRNIQLKLDKKTFANTEIAYIYNYGDEIPRDSVKTKSEKHIGTIAPDLFQNKFLVIDFPNQRIRSFDKLPMKYKKTKFINAIMRKGRIKIPIKIGDSTEYVMFDTGNCLGDLLLDKETVAKYSDKSQAPQEFLNGKTWGQDVAYFKKNLLFPIYLDNEKMKISTAQFSNLDSDVQFNKEEKIIGLIGPLFFIDRVVIIDYKNSRFGILK